MEGERYGSRVDEAFEAILRVKTGLSDWGRPPRMTAWGVRVEIPLVELGRVRLPRTRIRYADGWVRFGYNRLRTRLVAILEDREGKVLPAPSQVEACVKASRLGFAVAHYLKRFNRYEPGEDPGRHDQIRVAMA